MLPSGDLRTPEELAEPGVGEGLDPTGRLARAYHSWTSQWHRGAFCPAQAHCIATLLPCLGLSSAGQAWRSDGPARQMWDPWMLQGFLRVKA